MTHAPTDPRFTWADLEAWTGLGLLHPEQLTAIRAHLTDEQAARVLAVPATAVREQRAGLNLVTVAYYFGAFIILLAGTIFVGLQWEDLGRPGQLVAAWGVVAGLWLLGGWLRRGGHMLGGNLLIFAGAGIVPLAVYTALRLLNLWPDSAEAGAYQAFYRTIDTPWIILEVVSILVTLAVIRLTRFPLLTLLLAFWGWYLSMDLTELVAGHDDFAWGPAEWTVGATVGLAMLAIGVWLQRRGGQAWSRWFYLFGLGALLGNLWALTLDTGAAGMGLLFLAVAAACLVASLWLQSRIFLIFGALGCFAYMAGWPSPERSVAAAVGLLLLGVGVWQQRRHADQEWSDRFYLFGLGALFGNLGALALSTSDVAAGVLFLAVSVASVVASVWLQARLFLAFGALGCYAYIAKLAFDVFDRSLGFTVVLALVGLLLVLATVAYERDARPWLARRFVSDIAGRADESCTPASPSG